MLSFSFMWITKLKSLLGIYLYIIWYILTHFSSRIHFYAFWKQQKTFGLLAYTEGVEMEH